MPRITFIAFDGAECVVDAQSGVTLMENAVRNNVSGISAECGGACACATCHIYLDDSWDGTVDQPDSAEEEMLSFATGVKPGSRLACCVTVKEEHEGRIVHLPEFQG